ncbi:methionyl-tRNA formyltransferase [Ornithinimicrobium sp. Arc0846-15]|nr:methionyl-tRNA formyltransferase [Ornithinimicrobium laminariae]
MRIVFAGTPEPAVASLQALIASDHELVGVITRPDAKAGRGRTIVPSPIRQVAEQHGIPIMTPRKLTDEGVAEQIQEWAPEAIPVVAYGAIVPSSLLDAPTHGWINLHFSLLPAWRGAAPVQHAVMAGDEFTGASTFRIEKGLDTGPVFGMLTERVRAQDTAGDLLERLSSAGASLLVATLDALEAGELTAVPQSSEGVSLAPKIAVADSQVHWDKPALAIDRLVRGVTPAPGAWTIWRAERLKLGPVRIGEQPESPLSPGEVLVTKKAILVGSATETVSLGMVQPRGKPMMNAVDWARGARPEEGESMGVESNG